MSKQLDCDIAIVGAGPAGLIAAASLAMTGKHICLIDRFDPRQSAKTDASDTRSTAFLGPAIELFKSTGIWSELRPHAHRLRALRIVDLAGDPPSLRAQKTFMPDDLGLKEFGWNILNEKLKSALLDHLAGLQNVTFALGHGVERLFSRTSHIRLTLTDGTRVASQLAVAADGRNSDLRRLAGIEVTTTRYGQKSLAFSVLHDEPHEDISSEFYHEGGPFTMVPLGRGQHGHRSAVVWMNDGPRTERLRTADTKAFDAEMNIRTAGQMGRMTLDSHRVAFPIITQRATSFTAQRVAVMAEAAHVLPPIGAQGLNTSVGDVAALLDLVTSNNDPGSSRALTQYDTSREKDVRLRAGAIDLFNRVTRSGAPALQSLRLGGLQAAYHITPLRHRLMQSGMGPI